MDLDTNNGTFLNGERIEDQRCSLRILQEMSICMRMHTLISTHQSAAIGRYYELKEKDTIKFGNSSRDYVMLLDTST